MSELFSSDKLIDWLRQQPPDEEYQWQDPVKCLMGRYITDVGTPRDLYAYSEMPNYHAIAETKPWTFGAALQRALECKEVALKALPPPTKGDTDAALPAPGGHVHTGELLPALR